MIILIGESGYIGNEFKRQLNVRGIQFKSNINARTVTLMELINIYSNHFSNIKVDAIINAAGYTGKPNVDSCEQYKSDTLCGNVIFPQILTDFAMLHDIPLLHVSSGCIYTGTATEVFTEESIPNFTFNMNSGSFYSGTKELSENIISSHEKSWICRLRIPFEEYENSRNYITKLMRYDTLLNAPNSMSNKQEFVSACLDMIYNKIDYGTYNMTNTGYITAKEVTDLLRLHKITDKQFNFYGTEEEFYASGCAIAKRSNCVLDNSKLLNANIHMSDVHECIEKCIINYKFES